MGSNFLIFTQKRAEFYEKHGGYPVEIRCSPAFEKKLWDEMDDATRYKTETGGGGQVPVILGIKIVADETLSGDEFKYDG